MESIIRDMVNNIDRLKNTKQTRLNQSSIPTQVGHCKKDSHDVYIGRGDGGDSHLLNTEVWERGWLGNPFSVDKYGRVKCVEKYRIEFESRLEDDEEFREAVKSLSGSILGCWCQRITDDGPLCHGEVIVEHVERLSEENNS